MGQSVTALRVGLESLGGAAPEDTRIEQLIAVVEELDDHIDRLSHELRPRVIEDFGLITALSNHIDVFSERSGIPVDFHQHGFSDERIPAVTEMTLYRVAQEALTNVFRHARATSVSVILEKRDGQVQLIVEDDGSGFDPEEVLARPRAEHRLGLIGMRERVALAGGTLHIESGSVGGTSIFVRLTLSER
jgi:signal transduction histidine kinase